VHREAIGVDDLDSIIARMSDDKAVWMGISSYADEHCMAAWIEIAGTPSNSVDEAALGIEYLDLMLVVVNGVDVVLTIHTNTSGMIESSIVLPFPPTIDDESVTRSRMRETRSFGHGHDGGMRSVKCVWWR
jgi:hypothetical protein